MTSSSATSLHLSGRIPELDGLRGMAIGMILIKHFFVVVTVPGSPFAYAFVPTRLAWTGVDLFFVLSGFLIGGILLDARASSNYFRVFYTRRFLRIIPIYAVLLLCVFSLTLLWQARHLRGFDEIFGGNLPWAPFVLFLQNFEMTLRNAWGIFPLGVTWSLAVEEQFYLTLPVLIRFLPRRALLGVIFAGIILAPVLRTFFHSVSPNNYFAWYTLMPCRADALLLGVLGAVALREPRWRNLLASRPRFMSGTLLFLLLGVVFLTLRAPDAADTLMATAGFTWMALFYLVILLYAVLFPGGWIGRCLRLGWLRGLGIIAYGTYLVHELFLGLFFGRLPSVRSWRDFGVSMLALAFTLGFCRLSWLYFEKPLVKLGHRASYAFNGSGQVTLEQRASDLVHP
jgi:peptidoglycan/LPS O-acetylase OafA/YrhL